MNANMALLKCRVRKFLSLLSIFCSYPGNDFRNSPFGAWTPSPSLLRSVQGATAPPKPPLSKRLMHYESACGRFPLILSFDSFSFPSSNCGDK